MVETDRNGANPMHTLTAEYLATCDDSFFESTAREIADRLVQIADEQGGTATVADIAAALAELLVIRDEPCPECDDTGAVEVGEGARSWFEPCSCRHGARVDVEWGRAMRAHGARESVRARDEAFRF